MPVSEHWRLALDGGERPVPLARSYELPVAVGSQRSRSPLPASHVEPVQGEARLAAVQAAAAQVGVQQTGRGLRILSPAARHKGLSLVTVFMGMAFTGPAVFLVHQAAREGFMLYVMAGFFGLFGIPMFLGGLFMLARSLEVEIAAGRVTSQRRWAGVPLWRRSAVLSRAEQLVLTKGGSMTSGQHKTEYFHLQTSGRPTVRIAEGLRGREAAEVFRDNLIRLLGLA